MPAKRRILQITPEQFHALPQDVKDALILNEPIVVLDAAMARENPRFCISFAGDTFDMDKPCLHPQCAYYIPAKAHFHSKSGKFVFAGEISVGKLMIAAVA